MPDLTTSPQHIYSSRQQVTSVGSIFKKGGNSGFSRESSSRGSTNRTRGGFPKYRPTEPVLEQSIMNFRRDGDGRGCGRDARDQASGVRDSCTKDSNYVNLPQICLVYRVSPSLTIYRSVSYAPKTGLPTTGFFSFSEDVADRDLRPCGESSSPPPSSTKHFFPFYLLTSTSTIKTF